MLRELGAANTPRWTWTFTELGRVGPDEGAVRARYRAALAGYGVAPGEAPPAEAAACADVEGFQKAVEYQKKALSLPAFAKAHGKAARERLALYEQKKPFRGPAPGLRMD